MKQKNIRIIAGVIAVMAYILYFYSYKNDWFDKRYYVSSMIHFLGLYIAMILIFYSLQKRENSLLIKHLIYIPIVIFFSALVFLYCFNLFFDKLIDIDKPIIVFMACSIGSFVIYLFDIYKITYKTKKIFKNIYKKKL